MESMDRTLAAEAEANRLFRKPFGLHLRKLARASLHKCNKICFLLIGQVQLFDLVTQVRILMASFIIPFNDF